MMPFNPSRLKLARERRGLTLTALAAAIDMTPRIVSMYENGHRDAPPPATLQAIAEALHFPVGFFQGDDPEDLDAGSVSFRSLKSLRATQRNAALGAGRIALLLNEWIEQRFELPGPDLLDLRGEEPEAAAASLRQYWGLGERPIRNLVHLLEAKGTRIFSLAENTRAVDAYSFWKGNTPFVFLNTLKSAEHGRFDAAHELGHLVLHRHGGARADDTPTGRAVEQDADRFASAFLMPPGSVRGLAPRFASLDHLIQLKKQWTVSVAALVRRLKDLGLLTEWHYRTLCIELSSKGYRTQEPEGAARETSQVLGKVFEALRAEGISKKVIAVDIQVPAEEIETLLFSLVVVGLPGGRDAEGKAPVTGRARLRVVK